MMLREEKEFFSPWPLFCRVIQGSKGASPPRERKKYEGLKSPIFAKIILPIRPICGGLKRLGNPAFREGSTFFYFGGPGRRRRRRGLMQHALLCVGRGGGEDDTACLKLHVTNSRKKRGGGGGREGRMWETINNIEFIFPYRAERQRTVQYSTFSSL